MTATPTAMPVSDNPALISGSQLTLVIFLTVFAVILIFAVARLILDLRSYRYR